MKAAGRIRRCLVARLVWRRSGQTGLAGRRRPLLGWLALGAEPTDQKTVWKLAEELEKAMGGVFIVGNKN